MKQLMTVVLISLFFSSNAIAKEPNWSEYAKVLQQVQPGEKHGVKLALVDYSALNQSGQLEKAYQSIKQFDVTLLQGQDEKLAFYINTYNILALKMVVDHWPIKSIKEVGSFFSPVWGKQAGVIAGKGVSLDDIENDIIRPMADPRIHFAIVCASVSCPDLRNEPYSAAKLNTQLDEQVNVFLNNAKKGLLVINNELQGSKIFKWFAKDFKATGGVEVFIRRYRTGIDKNIKIEDYLAYDWSVNGVEK
ncbi:MAG: DUF547 domain-containing protein [Methyloprofundus sp.]|nr:DUF547 domain-containing protein [Methyloprofundus sp.]